MERRILIAMSDTGGGHRAVSRAVAESLERTGRVAPVPIVDLFALGARRLLVDRITRWYGPVIRTAPALYGLIYHATNRPTTFGALATALERPLIDRAHHQLSEHDPDIVVSVHGLVTRPFATAIDERGHRARLVTVIPDLVRLHRSWIQPTVHRYTAPTSEAVHFLQKLGVHPDKIELTGLPVDRRFTVQRDRAEVRREIGLDPDRLTVLISGGGEGGGGVPRLVDSVDRAQLPIQLIIVCGRNERAHRAILANKPRTRALILGFATNMPDLVQASDVVVTKGGPQSVSEALAAQRPVFITSVLPGQEQGNDRYVTRAGAGYSVQRPGELVQALRRFTTDPVERQKLTDAARKLGQPDAADRVAHSILDSLR